MRYKCHVNVEVVASSLSPRYLFSYINKGVDRVLFAINTAPTGNPDQQNFDEIQVHFISANFLYQK